MWNTLYPSLIILGEQLEKLGIGEEELGDADL